MRVQPERRRGHQTLEQNFLRQPGASKRQARHKNLRQLYPGWSPGSESGWAVYFVGKSEPARLSFWRLWVFNNASWDPRSFDFERDRDIALAKLPYVDATVSDLHAYQASGGKLLIYHGEADPVVPFEDSIHYYGAAEKHSNPTKAFLRLYLVPGMYHCTGGPGTSNFDLLNALDG